MISKTASNWLTVSVHYALGFSACTRLVVPSGLGRISPYHSRSRHRQSQVCDRPKAFELCSLGILMIETAVGREQR